MDGAYFKTYQMKMWSQLFQIRTIYTLLLFFVHRVMTDLPSLLAHLPLRQVTGKGSKVSGKKKKRSKCLLAYSCCKEKGA